MEGNKNIPTAEGEAIAPEAPATDIPGTDAPPPDLTAGTPPQEQAGVTMPEPGDVVVSFDKIEELMAERRAAARDTVEKAEPAAPEAGTPAVEPVDPILVAKEAEKVTEEKSQEEVAAEQKNPAVAVPRKLKRRMRRQSPAGAAHPRRIRRPPTRPSRPNLETKCPEVKKPPRPRRRLPPRNRQPLAVIPPQPLGSRQSPKSLYPRPVPLRRAKPSISS